MSMPALSLDYVDAKTHHKFFFEIKVTHNLRIFLITQGIK